MLLRAYQTEAVEASLRVAQHARALIAAPTGTGKTIMMRELARRRCQASHKPTLLLVHTDELAEQATEKLRAADIFVFLEKAASKPAVVDVAAAGSARPVAVVASVPTLHEKRRARWPPDMFGLILVDEAHHSVARTWRAVLEYFEGPTVGVTATANREGLAHLYEMAYSLSLVKAIDQGWLVPPRFFRSEIEEWDLSGLRVSGGRDVTDGQLAESFGEGALHAFMSTMWEYAQERKSIAFLPSVAAAARVADWLKAAKQDFPAFFIEGNTPHDRRREIVKQFRLWDEGVLSNCGVLTEGFDCPDVNAIFVARPTRSERLYQQMIGRGLRPDAQCIAGVDTAEKRRAAIAQSDKPSCYIYDFGGTGASMTFQCPAQLLEGAFPQAAEAAQALAKEKDEYTYDEVKVRAAQMHAEQKAYEAWQRQEALRRRKIEEARPRTFVESVMEALKGRALPASVKPSTDRQKRYMYRLAKTAGLAQKECTALWQKCEKEWMYEEASEVIRRLKEAQRGNS